jgi:hypothetical protein
VTGDGLSGALLPGVAALACGAPVSVAQSASLIDTFSVPDIEARPGETIAIPLHVTNQTSNLAAIGVYFRIDEDFLEWVGEWDYDFDPARFFVKYDTLPRAQIPGLFQPIGPPFMQAVYGRPIGDYAVFLGAGSNAAVPIGRGELIQFYVKVRESAPTGTQTMIQVFNPVDVPPHDDPRESQYADITGTVNTTPTLVSATVTIHSALWGDSNDDGEVSTSDITFLVAFIFGNGPAPDVTSLGDANCDGLVNISDCVYLVDYIYNGGPEPGCP